VIFAHVRHGRSGRDAKNLADHLAKSDGNDEVKVARIVGLAAQTLPGAFAAMRRLAPHRAAAALHHISISPAVDCGADDLVAAADRVLVEMGADAATHPHILVLHGKASAAGRGTLHAHLVVAHWGTAGKALEEGWLHLRLERLARELEFDAGLPLTPGRHDKALAKALRGRGRHDVADALGAAMPSTLPRSAITPQARQALKRRGVSDVDARVAVKAAWEAAGSLAALHAALERDGFRLQDGAKAGVHVVATAEGVEIGALDRILRLKRADVRARMESLNERTPHIAPDRPIQRDTGPNAEHRRSHPAPPEPSVPAGGDGRRVAAGRPARGPDRDSGGAEGGQHSPWTDRGGASRSKASKAGLARRVRNATAVRALAEGLKADELKEEAARRFLARRLDELRHYYEAALARRDQARLPIPAPPELAAAKARAAKADAALTRAREDAEQAEGAHTNLTSAAPKGWRHWLAWMTGDLRRHRIVEARAADELERADQQVALARWIATGMAVAVDLETDRAREQARREADRRRQVENEAARAMERAGLAVNALRRNSSLADLTVEELLRRAEAEMRRHEALIGQREAREAGWRAPQPRMR
jgi:hypothetical protein